MQKPAETALDTPEKEGTESSFPIKMHSIPGKTPAIYKIFCGAKSKRKIANPCFQRFAIQNVPGAGAGFLNLSSPRVNLMECCAVDKWL